MFYKIDEKKRTIVALSSFAGKTVVGVARCAPADTFDVEAGKKIAAARCTAKIAEKRMKRAEDCYSWAKECVQYWTEQAEKMKHYDADSVEAYKKAVAALAEIEENFCK